MTNVCKKNFMGLIKMRKIIQPCWSFLKCKLKQQGDTVFPYPRSKIISLGKDKKTHSSTVGE